MRYVPHDASTAKKDALFGLIFYILVTFGWLLFFLPLLLGWLLFSGDRLPDLDRFPISLTEIPLILLVIILAVLAYSTYKKIKEGQHLDSRSPSLILGILGLFPFFGGLLGGIFFLLAYLQLKDVLKKT